MPWPPQIPPDLVVKIWRSWSFSCFLLSPADPFPGKDQYLWAITSYAAERAIMFVPKEEYGDFRS
jgi:hypothetical protein